MQSFNRQLFLKDFFFFKSKLDGFFRKLCLTLNVLETQILWPWRSATLLKRNSHTGIFLWNLRNLQEHLLWRTFANDLFFQSVSSVHVVLMSSHYYSHFNIQSNTLGSNLNIKSMNYFQMSHKFKVNSIHLFVQIQQYKH